MAESPDLADEMGRAASGRARDLFGPERHTSGLFDIYRSILPAAGSGAATSA